MDVAPLPPPPPPGIKENVRLFVCPPACPSTRPPAAHHPTPPPPHPHPHPPASLLFPNTCTHHSCALQTCAHISHTQSTSAPHCQLSTVTCSWLSDERYSSFVVRTGGGGGGGGGAVKVTRCRRARGWCQRSGERWDEVGDGGGGEIRVCRLRSRHPLPCGSGQLYNCCLH